MKIKIGLNSISIGERHIRSFNKKEDFVKSMSNELDTLDIDGGILAEKLGEAYDLVIPPKDEAVNEASSKDEAAKESAPKKKATGVNG
jgi:hypothetical protein